MDYWTQSPSNGCPATLDSPGTPLVSVTDLWDGNGPSPLNGTGECGTVRDRFATCDCTPCARCRNASAYGTPERAVIGPFEGSAYADDLFAERVVSVIESHNASSAPLFLFWAPHAAHTPLQVPKRYEEKFAFIPHPSRRVYHAMVAMLDDWVARVVGALRSAGMWDNTLLVFASDNGGPIYLNGTAGASNYPLRGGKLSNWQGGIRVPAFVSGGFLPPAVRGGRSAAAATLWDIYPTFAALAQTDATDHEAAAAGLPPVDGVNQWPVWSGENASARTEVAIGTAPVALSGGNVTVVQGLIQGDYKLLVGPLGQSGWVGPRYPNMSTDWLAGHAVHDCTTAGGKPACLFHLPSDPGEHRDIAEQHPALVASMLARLWQVNATAYTPDRGADDGAACKAAMSRGRYFGPFAD